MQNYTFLSGLENKHRVFSQLVLNAAHTCHQLTPKILVRSTYNKLRRPEAKSILDSVLFGLFKVSQKNIGTNEEMVASYSHACM
ncbi:MAG: hypothetical protein Q4E59_04510 [Bacteroidales bacterium]|nr:hypothetical protein [Bacteroidales bacterium]